MTRETGFPSPARGYEAESIDLNTLLIPNPPATFLMRMSGDRLAYRGINDGDLLVVDRSRPPVPGSLTVIRQDGDFMCRELAREHGRAVLLLDAERVLPLDEDCPVFGTVTAVIRRLAG